MKTRLVLTVGEPAGVGPDVAVKWASTSDLQLLDTEIVLVADPHLLAARASQLRIPFEAEEFRPDAGPASGVSVIPIDLRTPVTPGTLDPRNAAYVLEGLELAVDGCEAGTFDAMVTAPVNKAVMNEAGIPFTGHTEWLASRTGADKVVMMLATGQLRIALATTHLPIAEVPAALETADLVRTLTVLHDALVAGFGIAAPHIHVCGLNPHAGEGGHLGAEDDTVIAPAVAAARAAGIDAIGPLSADTAFTRPHLDAADAVLVMFHDQGLPVLKYAGFGNAVNVTLGLPIIRTSVDHGTALDLAGTGQADYGSLATALHTAAAMVTAERSQVSES